MALLLAVNPNSCTPEQIDSFCQVYTQVLRNDGKVQAPQIVKRRLLANELTYRKLCPPVGA